MRKNRIAKLRKAVGMTQAQLADRLFVAPATIANWEKCRREPSIPFLFKLSELFDAPIDYIVCGLYSELHPDYKLWWK